MTSITFESPSLAMEELNTYQLRSFHYNKEDALIFLQKEIEDDYCNLNHQQTKSERHKYFSIRGTKKSDYEEKILRTTEGFVRFGIRHLGAHRDHPFVELSLDYGITNKDMIFDIYKKIADQISIFKPKYIKFWSNNKNYADFIRNTYLIGNSKKIRQISVWGEEDKMEFIQIKDLSFYPWYEKCYENFYKENSDLSVIVQCTDKTTLNESLEDKLLSFIFFEGKRVGLIAGKKSPFLGHKGLYFNEIFIIKEFRGRGLAKAAQRKFVEKHTNEEEFVWGTIDSQNLPSYKTALANGREAARFECFINI